MNRSDVFWSCGVRNIVNVKSLSFVLDRDRDFVRLTPAINMNVFSRILPISVNDGVCQGNAIVDVAHAFRNTAAIPE